MSNHLVFSFESFSPFRTIAGLNRTVMGTTLRVDIRVRTAIDQNKNSSNREVLIAYLRRYWVWKGGAVQPS